MFKTHKKLIVSVLTAIIILAGILGNIEAKAAWFGAVSDNSTFGWYSNFIWSTAAGTVSDVAQSVAHPFSQNAFTRDVAQTQEYFKPAGGFEQDAANVFANLEGNDAQTEAAYDRFIDRLKGQYNSLDPNDAAGKKKLQDQMDELAKGKANVRPDTQKVIDQSLKDQAPSAPSIVAIIGNIFAWLLYYIVWAMSWIIAKEVDVLLSIISYPINLSIDPVSNGWAIVRDFFNNFFIVILLAIAVGTIFRIPTYKYKEALPKLLAAAVLINFSKLIAGVFIDVSQIMMLSFAAPLVTIKGNNIILAALGLPDLVKFMDTQSFTEKNPLNVGNIIVVMIWGIIVGFVAFIVIACIIITLAIRIVFLLFLAILSPLPFFANSFEKLKSYGNEWWSLFTKYLIVGPAMLFFLWISFSIMGFSSQTASLDLAGQQGASVSANLGAAATTRTGVGNSGTGTATVSNATAEVLSKAMTTTGMINFTFVIVLLVMSLMMGQRFGAQGAGISKTGLNFLNKTRKRIQTGAYDRATGSRLGSVVSRIGRMPGISLLGGAAAANYFDSQRAKVQDTAAKRDQTMAGNRIKAGGFDRMNEKQLFRMANDMDRHTRMAALQTLSKKGLLRDDRSLNDGQRQQRIEMINQARRDFSTVPEFLQSFDDSVRKYSPNFALQSTMYNKNGQIDIETLTSDITTGKMDLNRLMGSLNTQTADLLGTSLHAAGIGTTEGNALTQFVVNQTRGDQKEMEKIFGSMEDEIRDHVGAGIDHAFFAGDDDLRQKYIKASKNLNFAALYDVGNREDLAMADNFTSENGDFIAANATAERIHDIITTIGHALDAKSVDKLVSRSKEMKTNVQEAFRDLADGIQSAHIGDATTNRTRTQAAWDTAHRATEAARTSGSSQAVIDRLAATEEEAKIQLDAAKGVQDRHKSIFQNTLLSGATFDVGTDTNRRRVLREVMRGKKKKDILDKMNTKSINQNFVETTYEDLSGSDYEKISERSDEDKVALRSAFTASVGNVAINRNGAGMMVRKALQADAFDNTIATSAPASLNQQAFGAALGSITSDQLGKLDDSLHTNTALVSNLVNNSDISALMDWLSSSTTKNINLRRAVLDEIRTGSGGSRGLRAVEVYARARAKKLV